MRRGHSLLELIVVLALIAVLGLISIPAVQKARSAALRMSCASNLRQIGLAVVMYEDSQGAYPYARLCPAPWRGGSDPHCQTLPSPSTWTGPNEIWWAPYDNRPGTDPTRALPGYVLDGILYPFVEKNPRVFQCPAGLDTTPGSPTFGRTFQIGYEMNPAIGGKRRINSVGGFARDHMDLPTCASAAIHWTLWSADPATVAARHSPPRHDGVYNVLHGDDHVTAQRP